MRVAADPPAAPSPEQRAFTVVLGEGHSTRLGGTPGLEQALLSVLAASGLQRHL